MSLSRKWDNLVGLFKNSLTIIGKDQDLLTPIFFIALVQASIWFLAGLSAYFFFIQSNLNYTFYSFVTFLVLIPLSFFLTVRYQAALAWMTVEVLQGKDTNLDRGVARLEGQTVSLMLVAFIRFLFRSASAQGNKNNALVSFLISLFFAVLKGLWDVAENFMLPVMVVERLSFSKSIDKLKLLKQNWPAALAGVLGMELLGGVVSSFFGLFFIGGLLLGGVFGHFGANIFPEQYLIHFGDKAVNLLPVGVTFFLFMIASCFISAFVQGLKTIYYSIFYYSLTHPDRIRADIRAEVTDYLNMDQQQAFDFFKGISTNNSLK